MDSQQRLLHVIYIICLGTVVCYVFKFKLCAEGIYSIKVTDSLNGVRGKDGMDEDTVKFSTTKVRYIESIITNGNGRGYIFFHFVDWSN